MPHRHLVLTVILALVVTGQGCKKAPLLDLAEAGGVVKYEGEPLAEASVMFIPDSGMPAHGVTDSSGSYTLSTRGNPGAAIGSGIVTITAAKENYPGVPEDKLTPEQLNNLYTELIPGRYNSPRTSGLKVTIKAGEKNDLSFDLTK